MTDRHFMYEYANDNAAEAHLIYPETYFQRKYLMEIHFQIFIDDFEKQELFPKMLILSESLKQ